MKKLQLKDLLSALSPQQQQEKQKEKINTSNATHQFLEAPSQKIKELPLRQQLKLKREGTYRNTQQEMDKWIGIVKLNREKQSLNFATKEKDNAASVSFFPAAPISDFHSKMQGQLKNLQINSQKVILSKQEQALAKLSKQQAKQRLKQARKQRTLHFNQQIKRRRIAKIKSKLYHKIKKRQKLREQVKKIQGLQGEQKNQYLQKMTKQRINERITLRHKSKNKHIQNLLRFNKSNKQGIQQSINEVNAIRHQQLQKANQGFNDNLSDQLDDDNYREQLQDIQKQIDEIENDKSKEKGLNGMRFMKIGLQKELIQEKKQANSLLKLLDDPEAMDIEQEAEEEQEQEKQITRRKFGDSNQKQPQNKTQQSFIQRNLKKALMENDQLVQGIDVNRLKQKYQPQRADLDLTQAIKIHKQAFNSANPVLQENYKEFQAQKYQDYQAQVPEDKKKLKGWGTWIGPGISEPKVDHAAEVKKKLAKIQEIKRKRRDGQMSGVIIRENYNKDLKDYFVNKLPHNYKSTEQFDYMQNQKLGPEWNTLNQFSSNIIPKVITKAGRVIQAIKMPKYLEKKKK